MVRCWKHSQHHLDEAQCTDGDPAVPSQFRFPHKAFWPSLTAVLLLFILVFGLTGHFRTSQPSTQSLQIVRFSSPDPAGRVVNQSAVVDPENDIVTFYLISPVNERSTVLFDIRQGLICYKPVHQKTCFLQKMEESDYDNVRSFLLEPKQKAQYHLVVNETLRQTEFLSVVGSSVVDMSTLNEPLQQLCQDRSVHWTKKTDGPGKQRLVYFCIDICFPSNICVSVCFYYLPE
ncbi:BRICHOS domain-containing protein 5 isoform X2 [Boleophthalmus pectinirostris]|uniref:BRICHOS domain-containing protein 5 isoform X2 n=1 Tax=Boleophthalmus pectinirostris TaxID=150288 RepID=UPI00242E19E4|nr:BRICHOS domain-containing protein 5 isoform X2 [Boleophthalmus pectinirostris]